MRRGVTAHDLGGAAMHICTCTCTYANADKWRTVTPRNTSASGSNSSCTASTLAPVAHEEDTDAHMHAQVGALACLTQPSKRVRRSAHLASTGSAAPVCSTPARESKRRWLGLSRPGTVRIGGHDVGVAVPDDDAPKYSRTARRGWDRLTKLYAARPHRVRQQRLEWTAPTTEVQTVQ